MNQGEEGAVDPNAERQRDHRNQCERAVLRQPPGGEATVAPDAADGRKQPHRPHVLAQPADVAEPADSGRARVGRPRAGALRFLHGQMKCQFVVEVALEPAAPDNGDQAAAELGERVAHRLTPSA